MKVCIVGAGAIGLVFGARLAATGHQVCALARGATLAALQDKGMRLEADGAVTSQPVRPVADSREAGVQDLVVVAVKQPALAAVAPAIPPLLGPGTMVLTAMNGVPWWFFDGLAGPLHGTALDSVDRGGGLRSLIPTARVMGCVVHMSCAAPEPGLSRIGFGNGIIVGEAAGGASPRLEALLAELRAAGFDAKASLSIQHDIWYKLWGNMTMNPISALTGATSDRILDDVLVNDLVVAVMTEAAAVGAAIGCPILQTPAERNAVTRQLGAMRTSMLQDADKGRRLEIDALLAVVHEIAGRVGMPVPHTAGLLGLIRLFARQRGLYD
ncbi:MAG TPA: 2-dehydropantoate 2-reductase [Rhodocyclaceae bacterium]|nr:2-dehydropantoate 2-reductase [Rhodocyclaceae bacterium]